MFVFYFYWITFNSNYSWVPSHLIRNSICWFNFVKVHVPLPIFFIAQLWSHRWPDWWCKSIFAMLFIMSGIYNDCVCDLNYSCMHMGHCLLYEIYFCTTRIQYMFFLFPVLEHGVTGVTWGIGTCLFPWWIKLKCTTVVASVCSSPTSPGIPECA